MLFIHSTDVGTKITNIRGMNEDDECFDVTEIDPEEQYIACGNWVYFLNKPNVKNILTANTTLKQVCLKLGLETDIDTQLQVLKQLYLKLLGDDKL